MVATEPWVHGPLELIKHAEEHVQANGDFDKRIALISYDNAIEVSISTYLQLHPSQRKGAEYQKEDVKKWLSNYHSLLSFFFDKFIKDSGQKPLIDKSDIIHYHDLRNNLYHEGKYLVPSIRDIRGARAAALYVFSSLFSVNGVELLKSAPLLHTLTRPFKFRGSGNDIFKVPLKAGPVIFRITYKGKSMHTCQLCTGDGYQLTQLIPFNEGLPRANTAVKKYNKSMNNEYEGVYVLKVNADSGTWQVEVE